MSNNVSEPKANQPASINDLFCFAVYSASTAISRAYQPYLSKLGLTYPQYITLSALWEEDNVTLGCLCQVLRLETNTLTPILQRLEKRELIIRERGHDDGRKVMIRLTSEGRTLARNQSDIFNCVVADTDFDRNTLDNLVFTITELRDNLIENNS